MEMVGVLRVHEDQLNGGNSGTGVGADREAGDLGMAREAFGQVLAETVPSRRAERFRWWHRDFLPTAGGTGNPAGPTGAVIPAQGWPHNASLSFQRLG